jgi:DNA-binding NarL/FixJ family response regulator
MLKIFCIEDNIQEIYLIKHFLTEAITEGFHFDNAPSLKESFEKLNSEEFDLVILDLGLHDSLGLMTINKFKAQFPNMPVIVYSADNHEEAIQSVLNNGADAFVSKHDGHPSELAHVIEVFKSIKK